VRERQLGIYPPPYAPNEGVQLLSWAGTPGGGRLRGCLSPEATRNFPSWENWTRVAAALKHKDLGTVPIAG